MENEYAILCVDDDESTLDALERLLRKNFKIYRATSGLEALKILGTIPEIAVILSDYRMPAMTGVEFLHQAAELAPLATRAILTGQMDIQEIADAINTGAIHRLILKPWDNSYLLVQIREALANHRLLQEKQDLRQLAITDPVTGVYNHRHFQECLKREVDRALRHKRFISLLMIDIDFFKKFNDKYGHPEGDRWLREFGAHLRQHLRGIDLIFRYGGEEFAVIMPDTQASEAYLVAERIRLTIKDNKNFLAPLGLSGGIAEFTEPLGTAQKLIVAADQALYQAKNQGRDRTVVFTQDMAT